MRSLEVRLSLAALLALSLGTACKKPAPVPEKPVEAPVQAPAPVVEAKPVVKPTEDPGEAARRAEAERLAAMQKAAAAVLKDINFDFDRSDIREADKAKLQAIAGFLRTYGSVKLRIEGHCDERGTNEYNIALGNRRAAAALSYLKALGVAEERLDPISYGKERPKVTGHEEESWFVNRRDEFKLN